MMDKRTRLNLLSFFNGELKDHEIPEDEKIQLNGMKRVETWRPDATRYAKQPALILAGFVLFILLLAKLWLWMLLVVPVGLAAFLLFYLYAPTICRECKKEMDYYRPQFSGIRYDWCKRCKCYCNVRWVPEGQE